MKKRIALKVLLTSLTLISTTYAQEMLSGYKVSLDKSTYCAGFPKANVKTLPGSCLGIVASEKDGLKKPRRILELDSGDFIITDMVNWGKNKAIVWKLSLQNGEKSLTKLFTKVDRAHGLAMGPDGLVYVGTPGSIFRFDGESSNPQKEVIISDLPSVGNHPLTHFIFNKKGDLIVNVGAPTDQCEDTVESKKQDKIVITKLQCDEDRKEAVLRKYSRSASGKYSTYQIIASGLRNSMALAVDPVSLSLYQGENNMDFKEADKPEEEINLIDSRKHFGWPYCYAHQQLNPNYLVYKNQIRCERTQPPVTLLPAHSAPLDMLFYQGEMFPELKNNLIISLHGYRPTGQRIITLGTSKAFTNKKNTSIELIGNWAAKEGHNPKGSPTGMHVAKNGSLWFVEDRNKTVMVLTKGQESENNRDDEDNNLSYKLSDLQLKNLQTIQKDLFQSSCTSCHGQLENDNVKELWQDLLNDGWLSPKKGLKSLLYQRVSNDELGRRMPLGQRALKTEELKELKAFIQSL